MVEIEDTLPYIVLITTLYKLSKQDIKVEFDLLTQYSNDVDGLFQYHEFRTEMMGQANFPTLDIFITLSFEDDNALHSYYITKMDIMQRYITGNPDPGL